MEAGPFLSETQVAERWGMSPKTLQRWRVIRVGPVYLKIGGSIRYRLCDVERFEEAVLTKCDGSRPDGKRRVQEDQAPQITPRYSTLKDALEAPATDELARSSVR